MAKGITELSTGSVHGEKQVAIVLTDDGFSWVMFETWPGSDTVACCTHPVYERLDLTGPQMDDLIGKLTELRRQLPA